MRPSLATARSPAQKLSQAQTEDTVAKHLGQTLVPGEQAVVGPKLSLPAVMLPQTPNKGQDPLTCMTEL